MKTADLIDISSHYERAGAMLLSLEPASAPNEEFDDRAASARWNAMRVHLETRMGMLRSWRFSRILSMKNLSWRWKTVSPPTQKNWSRSSANFGTSATNYGPTMDSFYMGLVLSSPFQNEQKSSLSFTPLIKELNDQRGAHGK